MNADVYNRVTDKIIAELEKGERPTALPYPHSNRQGAL